MKKIILVGVLCFVSVGLAISDSDHPTDPGPRGEPVSAGGYYPGVSGAVMSGAQDGATRFEEPETVGTGLGPLYNSGPVASCSECHAQPAMGGSAPSSTAYPNIGSKSSSHG